MVDLTTYPAVWGACGAAFYAGTQLTTSLWGGETAPDGRARKRALARFALAVFFGPVAAAALTAPLIRATGGHATAPAMGLAIGLSANALWPLFIEGVGKEFTRALGAMLKRMGSALSNGDDG